VTNAVIDALYRSKGIRHMDMPCNPARVWMAMQGKAEPPQ
jgi:aerobic carbon-monoxide dehydrogenase large subunit